MKVFWRREEHFWKQAGHLEYSKQKFCDALEDNHEAKRNYRRISEIKQEIGSYYSKYSGRDSQIQRSNGSSVVSPLVKRTTMATSAARLKTELKFPDAEAQKCWTSFIWFLVLTRVPTVENLPCQKRQWISQKGHRQNYGSLSKHENRVQNLEPKMPHLAGDIRDCDLPIRLQSRCG